MKARRALLVAAVLLAPAAAFAVNAAIKMNGVQLTPLASSPVVAGGAGISADASKLPRWDDGTTRRFIVAPSTLGTAGQCLTSAGAGVEPSFTDCGLISWPITATNPVTFNIATVVGQQAAMSLIASTVATSAGTISNSPGILMRAADWNTSALAGQPFDFFVGVVPTAANPVTGQLSIYSQANGGGMSERFRITPTRATALQGFVVTQGFAPPLRSAASTVTVASSDRLIAVTGTGARTVNMLATSACLAPGQEFVIQEAGNDTGVITINRAGSDTINGGTSTTIAAAYGSKTLACNAGAWLAR